MSKTTFLSPRQLFLRHQGQTSDFPLMIEVERAEGVYMYGKEGNKLLDLIAGIGVSSLGHRHPKVLEAIHHQLEHYMHLMVYGEFVQTPQAQLAEALASTLPPNLSATFLVNSGSEAIEGAMKLAKRYTGRTEIVSAFNAYHGSTHGALSIGGGENFKANYRPLLPDIKQIHYGLQDDLGHITERTAAVVLETVQGEAGVRQASQEYMQALRKKCDEVGALLVLDEIQAGVGRTGRFWAFEHYGIVPDILASAKGLGGGMPIGAFISSPEIMGVLKDNPILGHITTFGGHPVSCAAALATVRELKEGGLVQKVEQKAKLFRELLVHPKITEVRNKGLMMAVGFESFEVTKPIIDKAIELGVLSDWFLYCDNALRIAPPLIIEEADIRFACDTILRAIDEAGV